MTRAMVISSALAWRMGGRQKTPIRVLGAVVGIGLVILRGRDRQIPIPFGPYLAVAGLIALLPNLFPVAILFAVMALFDIPLNAGTSMVAAIALGICVDEARARRETHDGRGAGDLVADAVEHHALHARRGRRHPLVIIGADNGALGKIGVEFHEFCNYDALHGRGRASGHW